MTTRNQRLPAILALTALLGACGDGLPPERLTAPEQSGLSGVAVSSALAGVPPFLDEEYVDVAKRVPGYGGHYFDEVGNLVVYLKDFAQADLARAVLTPTLARHRENNRTGSPEIQIQRAAYDFVQLTLWRWNVLPSAIGSIPGVQMIGTSKRHNRLHVGVRDDDARQRVLAELARHGVPGEAVIVDLAVFETHPEITVIEDDGSGSESSGDSLTSYASRLQGGRRVWTEENPKTGGGGACTIGLIGRGLPDTPYWGLDVMVVPSHCTETMDGVNDTQFRQPSSTDGWIGYEYQDGLKYWSHPYWKCGYAAGCRQGDGILARLNGSRAPGIGEIARPRDSSGTLLIDWANPIFKIRYAQQGRYNSDAGTIHKIGQKTGWTNGQLTLSCYDFPQTPDGTSTGTTYIICAQGASYYSAAGDSGAPVFTRDPYSSDVVDVRAIHIGAAEINGVRHGIFSPLVGIQSDLSERYSGAMLLDIDFSYF